MLIVCALACLVEAECLSRAKEYGVKEMHSGLSQMFSNFKLWRLVFREWPSFTCSFLTPTFKSDKDVNTGYRILMEVKALIDTEVEGNE